VYVTVAWRSSFPARARPVRLWRSTHLEPYWAEPYLLDTWLIVSKENVGLAPTITTLLPSHLTPRHPRGKKECSATTVKVSRNAEKVSSITGKGRAIKWRPTSGVREDNHSTQSVGLLGRGISPSQGIYLHTEQHKHRINTHNTDIHVLSGIRIHDPSVWANEDGDQPDIYIVRVKILFMIN
jgi:hypothetical protein